MIRFYGGDGAPGRGEKGGEKACWADLDVSAFRMAEDKSGWDRQSGYCPVTCVGNPHGM